MSSLTLYCTLESGASLLRAEFEGSDGARHVSVRGTIGDRASEAGGTFAWTSAVQGLVLLLVRHCVYNTEEYQAALGPTPGHWANLTGERGSLAASLDYALSKRPNWVLDFFGATSNGEPHLRRYLWRMNPERRRPGPVTIGVRPDYLPPDSIRMVMDGISAGPAAVRELILALEALDSAAEQKGVIVALPTAPSAGSHLASIPAAIPSAGPDPMIAVLREGIVREVSVMLRRTDIFTRSCLNQSLARVHDDPSFSRVAGKGKSAIQEIDRDLNTTARYGISESGQAAAVKLLENAAPVTVAISPAHLASFAILENLVRRGLPLKIEYKIAHSVEMARRIIKGDFASPPMFCSLTVATAASVLSKNKACQYRPFLLMPGMSHGILAPASAVRSDRADRIFSGEYMFMSDIPSTEAFYYEDLIRRKVIDPRRARAVDGEPDESAYRLMRNDPDFRFIVGFPYYLLNTHFNNGLMLNKPYAEEAQRNVLLFSRCDPPLPPEVGSFLQVSIRDSWLELIESPALVKIIVDRILGDPGYRRFLYRCVGARRFPAVDPLLQAAANE